MRARGMVADGEGYNEFALTARWGRGSRRRRLLRACEAEDYCQQQEDDEVPHGAVDAEDVM